MSEKTNKEMQPDLIDQWKTIVGIQMHFNDMIIRMRTLGVTVVVAVYGAAAASIGQYPKQYISIFGKELHISIIGVLLGLLLLISVFIIDRFYYYELLIGSVERAEELENLLTPIEIKGKKEVAGITQYLTKKVGRGRANIIILVFYGLAFAFGLVFLLYIWNAYQPIIK
jgi:hypothetical protein